MIRDAVKWYKEGVTPVNELPLAVMRRLHGNLRPYVHALHKVFPGMVKVGTSVTDRFDYTQICKQASVDDTLFNRFKRHPSYVPVLEHVSFEQGQAYLNYIHTHYPVVLEDIELIKVNDRIGSPKVFDYEGVGKISPTTLRYAKIAGDILNLFSPLGESRVIEIGPAYGGQCTVLSKLALYGEYIGVDLPASLQLMKRYVETLHVPSVTLLDQNSLLGNEEYDLAISNYAFSECSKDVQDYYVKKVFSRAKRGYILYNADSPDSSLSKPWVPYNRRSILEILGKFHDITVTPEAPSTGRKEHVLLVWGSNS